MRQALAFQERFRLACDRHARSGPRPYAVHYLASVDFPTPEALVLPAGPGGERLADDLLGPGDGTVPRRSALADWTGTDPMLWTGFRNADLASAPALRDTMRAVRRGLTPGETLAGPEGIVLSFPRDPVAAGRPFVIDLLGHDLPQRDLRTFVWRSGRVREKQPVVFRQYEPDRYRAELEVTPGRWVVEALVDRPKGRDRKDVAARALTWLALAMTVTVFVTMLWGLPKTDPDPVSEGTADGRRITLTTRKPTPVDPDGPYARRLSGERFEKSLRVVTNSVIFRASGQDLTTTGTYVEMAARLVEPGLLALAVLAVRSRVKR